MTCKIRKWKFSDAADLVVAISNKKVQDNLRDGLPYPYNEQDGINFISDMFSVDENETFAFAITVDSKAVGSIGVFRQANIHRQTAELGYYIAEEYWGKGNLKYLVDIGKLERTSRGVYALPEVWEDEFLNLQTF